MKIENLSTLKINQLLSQEQYNTAYGNGKINDNEIYLIPDNQEELILTDSTNSDNYIELNSKYGILYIGNGDNEALIQPSILLLRNNDEDLAIITPTDFKYNGYDVLHTGNAMKTEEIIISSSDWFIQTTIDSTDFYKAAIDSSTPLQEEDQIFYKVSSNYSDYTELKQWSKVASHIVDLYRTGVYEMEAIAAIPTGTIDQFLNNECKLTITIIKGGSN